MTTINVKGLNPSIEQSLDHNSESLVYSRNLRSLAHKIHPSKPHEIINKANII